MKNLTISFLAFFVFGCTPMPPASQLVLMAEANPDGIRENKEISEFNCLIGQDSNRFDSKETFRTLLDETITNQTGLNKAEREEALELLASGKFRSDLKDLVVLVLSTAPKVPDTALQTTNRLKQIPLELQSCLLGQCLNPKGMISLAQGVYKDPSIELTRQTLALLLDNQTFRLALIVYAHSNGIDINNADLDFIKNQLQKDQIVLAELVDEGKYRLKKKYKVDEFENRMECLSINKKSS